MMMADSVGEGSNAGGSGNHERRRPPATTRPRPAWARCAEARRARRAEARRAAYTNVRAYNRARVYAYIRAYVLLAMKVSGVLALLLSTVILLGGYVQSLKKTDFFLIMIISVIQAAGIFQDWESNLNYFWNFLEMVFLNFIRHAEDIILFPQLTKLLLFLFYMPLLTLFLALLAYIHYFYICGPLVCGYISSNRISNLNQEYHSDGTDSMTDMKATLYLFYSLIFFQGAMSIIVLLPISVYRVIVARDLRSLEKLSDKWGKKAIDNYLSHMSRKCRKDPLSITGMDMIKYAAELLDSESQKDCLYGARLLSAFVNKGLDVSWVLLPSRHRIQRLIDSLMISSSSSCLDEACAPCSLLSRCFSCSKKCIAVLGGLDDKKEIREHAATIVAHVAVHIDDLAKYPGAMRCISSLFHGQEETTQQGSYRRQLIYALERRRMDLMTDQKRTEVREHQHRNKRDGGTSNELVQQGLTIIERLASNSDINRRLICGTPGLLPKITAPVYSATLIQDVKNKAWGDIVTRCLKVLYQLIRAAGQPSRRLRRQIFSKHQALSNLESILLEEGNDEAGHQELQLVAMKILTQLALDLSINLTEETKKVLVKKQQQLFLHANGHDEKESAAIAGRAMVSLSANSESNFALIMTTENDITGRLTELLDENNITRRTIAAEIMANLCAHCNVDNMKEILAQALRKIMSIKAKSQEIKNSADPNSMKEILRKILREIMSIKIKSQQRKNRALRDEENQRNPVSTITEERHNIPTRGNYTETEEISDQEREEQESFLSLAQVICDKLSSEDLDGAIQNAVQNENIAGSEQQRREAFVEKLKTIIDDNCHPTADSLRIVKLCSRIAESVIHCKQYVEIFKKKGFKSSLSKTSETMSELESCMLFVGTDFGPKKTVRPLFSEIEKSFGQL